MNATPIQNVGLLENQRLSTQAQAPLDQQNMSLNTTALVNFKSGRTAKTNDYMNPGAPKVPTTHYIRAATANNAAKKRGSNPLDPFNNSIGFKSSASMARRNHLRNPNMTRPPHMASHLPGLSPQSAGENQHRLMQKL